ncbi:hydrogenase subunit MbhD domain-containing protein [Serpentinicella alkaliphila]|uniref:Putative MnhB-related membrane protein n=1 Tax=Serpentinicella alkaliphila TaxID=1734049 RepID=A0A4R2TRZ8_9FIRM|nr:hydrogenase subunit MbhD domain-containing protein [Serpentinicella alkaliphila]QUH25651.1 DUF4040 domain-containing protein [Serpentinicella alkaliphila]TCQ06638.1 putative MnhB-related membrane protein [Serpentinicella alkaliphila]
MEILNIVLIIFLIVCAVAVEKTKDLLGCVIIFGAYGLTMAILWLMLKAPDIALTEAAIGAGATTAILIATISRTRRIEK